MIGNDVALRRCTMISMLRSGTRNKGKKRKFDTHRPLSPKISCSPHARDLQSQGISITRDKGHVNNSTSLLSKGIEHSLAQRTVRADRASRVKVAHLAHDRSDPARAEPRSTAPDQLGARKNWRSASVVSRAKKWVKMPMIINSSPVGSLSMSEKNAVVERIRYFDLVHVLPRKSTPSSISSQMTRRRISPR